jgi:hypothetical protein
LFLLKGMLKKIVSLWKNYRYRFTPWQALHFDRHAVSVQEQHPADICDGQLMADLQSLVSQFRPPEHILMFKKSPERLREFRLCQEENDQVLYRAWGFSLAVKASSISGAGRGVYVHRGSIRKGQMVALYPGTVYRPYQPIL